jgi:hypothetical protein
MLTPPEIHAAPDPSPEARRQRLLLGAVMLGLLALALATLQASFDAGDRRRALAALATTPVAGAGGPRLVALLRERGGGAPPACDAEVLSAARGITRVICAVQGDPQIYAFRWDDLRRDRLEPEDEPTRRRLEGVAVR